VNLARKPGRAGGRLARRLRLLASCDEPPMEEAAGRQDGRQSWQRQRFVGTAICVRLGLDRCISQALFQ